MIPWVSWGYGRFETLKKGAADAISESKSLTQRRLIGISSLGKSEISGSLDGRFTKSRLAEKGRKSETHLEAGGGGGGGGGG